MNPPQVRRQVNPKTAADTLRRASKLRPRLAIVLGSGFQSVAQAMAVALAVPYAKLAGFPKPTVPGHTGKALIGTLGGTEIVVLSGRAHYYEGHSLETVTFPIRVLAEYGIENILLTNAAGGIDKKFRGGEFMQFTDHLNFIGDNPLRGALAKGRERFIDLSQTYDPTLNKSLQAAARKTKTKLHRGVYCALSGPSYETPAEIRALAKLGADAVGMSTVPEAIVARQCGLRVAAISCITNAAAGISKTLLSHSEVLKIGEQASTQAVKLITEFCAGKMPTAH
jgi:purine-nucleoside phosphorylase